jgi:hypothetical protein
VRKSGARAARKATTPTRPRAGARSRVLLAEHPNAPLSGADTRSFANVFRRV